jgi:GTP cyclohydrolase IIa
VPSTQLTLVQIDNYGPWTVTPEPRREPDLQALQARLYGDLAQGVGAHDGYAFYDRFDNMVAVTNGIDREDHRRLQTSLNNRYPVSVSLGVASAETPVAALSTAGQRLRAAGGAQDADRRAVLRGDPDPTADAVTMAHFDVVDVTGKYTDELNPFDTSLAVESGYLELARRMRRENDSLAFFVGGDNVVAVCPALADDVVERTIGRVQDAAGVEFQVGIGRGATAVEAGMAAKHALEDCRHNGTRVERVAAACD